jgi:hypothetical protein
MAYQIAQTTKGPIEYRLEGSGPVVMVLPGGHCSRDTRLSHEKLASAGFTLLTPSRPGYDTTPAAVGRTAQDAADALAALLDTLAIPRSPRSPLLASLLPGLPPSRLLNNIPAEYRG